MSANRADFPIATMARTLGVSKAGYYTWIGRPISMRKVADAALLMRIRTVHLGSHETYGAPRVQADRRTHGDRHSRKRIAPLMREAGLVGACHRRGGPVTTRPDREARPASIRRLRVRGPSTQLALGRDITHMPTASGFLYLAVVLDAFSRRVVGWTMANHLRSELVLDALGMAVTQRRPHKVIDPSDQGSQSPSLAFGNRFRKAGVRPSMGSVGDAYDNAMAKSFFSTLECELLARRRFRSRAEARMAVFSYTEGFYNPLRLHSALGYRSPVAFEHETEKDTSSSRLIKQVPNRPPNWGNPDPT